MKKLIVFLFVAVFSLTAISLFAQETKDAKSFNDYKAGVKAPMLAKILIENKSEFAQNLKLTPAEYKKMDLSGNWGSIVSKVEFFPQSNALIADFDFSFRTGDLLPLLNFMNDMDEEADKTTAMIEAGLFDLVINTSRAKNVTCFAEFELDGKKIKRNLVFLLEPVIEKDKDYSQFAGERPLFRAVITDQDLGIPSLSLKVKTEVDYQCVIFSEELGVSFALEPGGKDEIKVLASRMPKNGAYDFIARVKFPTGISPEIPVTLIVRNGEFIFDEGTFNPLFFAKGSEVAGRTTLVNLYNTRSEDVTVFVPEKYIAPKNSLKSSEKVQIDAFSKTRWVAIVIPARERVKIRLKSGPVMSIVYGHGEKTTEVLDLGLVEKSSQNKYLKWEEWRSYR